MKQRACFRKMVSQDVFTASEITLRTLTQTYANRSGGRSRRNVSRCRENSSGSPTDDGCTGEGGRGNRGVVPHLRRGDGSNNARRRTSSPSAFNCWAISNATKPPKQKPPRKYGLVGW